MDVDEELERAMLNITPSKLQLQSGKYIFSRLFCLTIEDPSLIKPFASKVVFFNILSVIRCCIFTHSTTEMDNRTTNRFLLELVQHWVV